MLKFFFYKELTHYGKFRYIPGNFTRAFSNFYTRKENVLEKFLCTYTGGERTMFYIRQLL